MTRRKNTSSNGITNIMTINLDVFGTLMKHGILRDVKRRLAITEQQNGWRMRYTQTKEQSLQPCQLSSNRDHRTVLSLGRGTRDSVLFLSLPRDRGRTKKHKLTRERSPSQGQLAQSESHHPVKSNGPEELRIMLCPSAPFK